MQYALSLLTVIGATILSMSLNAAVGYQGVALIMLMAVSLLAMMFDILPVLLAAMLSALVLNFLFIPPLYTFHIQNTEDLFLFLMYFLIALVNTVLTLKIRDRNSKIRDKEEKVKAIALYDTMLNSLSHELRTPISTMVGALDTLKEQYGQLSQMQRDELFEEMGKATVRLNQQVQNLLNISKIEAGMIKLSLDWVDLNEIIHSILRRFRAEAPSHEYTFIENDKVPLYKLDSHLIEQAMINIVHNATQYTPADSVITIEHQFVNECCQITITDNGPGFQKDEMAFAFEKFARTSSAHTSGLGLGLSIAKGFIEAHQGTLQLSATEKTGAKFLIHLFVETSFISNLKNE